MARPYELECYDDWKDDTYRYRLDATTRASGLRQLVVIQINPSIAGTAADSDPTAGKVSNWAFRSGYARVSFLNLFAYISTPQCGLTGLPYDVLVGPRNDRFITEVLPDATTLFAAWGKPTGVCQADYLRRIGEVKAIVGDRRTFRMGPLVDKSYPRHGLMWNAPHNADIQPFAWP